MHQSKFGLGVAFRCRAFITFRCRAFITFRCRAFITEKRRCQNIGSMHFDSVDTLSKICIKKEVGNKSFIFQIF